MDSLEIAQLAAQTAEDKLGRDVVVLQIAEVSLVCDYFVITSAPTRLQTRDIARGIDFGSLDAAVLSAHEVGEAAGVGDVDGREPQLLEPRDLGLRERLVEEVRERLPAHPESAFHAITSGTVFCSQDASAKSNRLSVTASARPYPMMPLRIPRFSRKYSIESVRIPYSRYRIRAGTVVVRDTNSPIASSFPTT